MHIYEFGRSKKKMAELLLERTAEARGFLVAAAAFPFFLPYSVPKKNRVSALF